MKKSTIGLLFLIVMLVASLAGCTTVPLGAIIGSGKMVTREMAFKDFSRLDVSHAFTVDISRADAYSVVITLDDNLVDYLQVSKTGNTLRIGLKPNHSYNSMTLKAKVTLPTLEGLHFSGATRGVIKGFKSGKDLTVDLSGASSLQGDMEAGDAGFNLSGASNATLKGAAQDVTLIASGASNAELSDFEVKNLNVTLSGASRGSVNVKGKMDVNLSGASQLTYAGDPQIGKSNISGASSMKRK